MEQKKRDNEGGGVVLCMRAGESGFHWNILVGDSLQLLLPRTDEEVIAVSLKSWYVILLACPVERRTRCIRNPGRTAAALLLMHRVVYVWRWESEPIKSPRTFRWRDLDTFLCQPAPPNTFQFRPPSWMFENPFFVCLVFFANMQTTFLLLWSRQVFSFTFPQLYKYPWKWAILSHFDKSINLLDKKDGRYKCFFFSNVLKTAAQRNFIKHLLLLRCWTKIRTKAENCRAFI